MARAPFAKWRPLPDHGGEPKITARVVVYHTMVGTLAGTERFFAQGTSIESHFGVGCPKCVTDGTTDTDGEIWQWMSTAEQADANFKANPFAISVETCDHFKGGVYTNPPLSVGQVAAWIRIGNWAAETHMIPRRKCATWNSPGFGYHSLFPMVWTPSAGKTCPNPTRIDQFHRLVLPAIVAGRDLEEADMTTEQAQQLDKLFKAFIVQGTTEPEQTVNLLFNRIRTIEEQLTFTGTATKDEGMQKMFDRVRGIEATTAATSAEMVALHEKLDAIIEALPDPDPDPEPEPEPTP